MPSSSFYFSFLFLLQIFLACFCLPPLPFPPLTCSSALLRCVPSHSGIAQPGGLLPNDGTVFLPYAGKNFIFFCSFHLFLIFGCCYILLIFSFQSKVLEMLLVYHSSQSLQMLLCVEFSYIILNKYESSISQKDIYKYK